VSADPNEAELRHRTKNNFLVGQPGQGPDVLRVGIHNGRQENINVQKMLHGNSDSSSRIVSKLTFLSV
jgi:uncharacterized protein (DUF2249 family)